jgi:hypothetical protein
MGKKMFLAGVACFLLGVSVLVYLCFRQDTVLFFRWLEFIGIDYSVFRSVDLALPSFVVYSLTNGLFMAFGYLFLFVIWSNDKKSFLFYSSLITLAAIIYEVVTRDLADILTITASFIICLVIYLRLPGVKNAG